MSMMTERGDRAVSATIYSMDGSPLDYRVVAALESAVQQIVWGSAENSLAWDINYVEVAK